MTILEVYLVKAKHLFHLLAWQGIEEECPKGLNLCGTYRYTKHFP